MGFVQPAQPHHSLFLARHHGPAPVIDYLAAHEVAHLVHADHSPAYWSVVERLVGDHKPWRKWLKDYGGALHAVGR